MVWQSWPCTGLHTTSLTEKHCWCWDTSSLVWQICSANQMSVLRHVNQSEGSIKSYQPIRGQYYESPGPAPPRTPRWGGWRTAPPSPGYTESANIFPFNYKYFYRGHNIPTCCICVQTLSLAGRHWTPGTTSTLVSHSATSTTPHTWHTVSWSVLL